MSTGGTGKHLKANGVDCEVVLKIQEGRPNIGDMVKNGDIAMMLITSTGAPSCMHACMHAWAGSCIRAAVNPCSANDMVLMLPPNLTLAQTLVTWKQ